MRLKKFSLFATPYLISLVSTGTSLLIALLIFTWSGRHLGFTIFLPAVMISTWYGGLRSGLLANILSVIAIYYFFTIPYYTFDMKSVITVIQLIIFIFEGLIISYFIDSGHRHEKINLYKNREKEQKKIIKNLQEELVSAKKETAMRDEFLAIASHELKTPLTTVVMQIQTTLHNVRNVSLSEFSVEHLLRVLQSMQGQTKRLSKMINDLLNISLISTHKMELELEEIDLATLIKDTAEGFEEKFRKEGSTIDVKVKGSVLGRWDKLRIEQVLDNLISNALKYGNKEPANIELEKRSGMAVIRVIDNGIGIKSSEKEKIFSLFRRGGIEQDYKGLGIGLFIARQIVELHGGRIELKSKLKVGSIFSVYLPIKTT